MRLLCAHWRCKRRLAIVPAVALAVILLLTRPHGAHAGFIGSIEGWWHNVFGGGNPQAPASASKLTNPAALALPSPSQTHIFRHYVTSLRYTVCSHPAAAHAGARKSINHSLSQLPLWLCSCASTPHGTGQFRQPQLACAHRCSRYASVRCHLHGCALTQCPFAQAAYHISAGLCCTENAQTQRTVIASQHQHHRWFVQAQHIAASVHVLTDELLSRAAPVPALVITYPALVPGAAIPVTITPLVPLTLSPSPMTLRESGPPGPSMTTVSARALRGIAGEAWVPCRRRARTSERGIDQGSA